MTEDVLKAILRDAGYKGDRIENGAEYLVKTGLLFEINRRFLNPLGLSLLALRRTYSDGSKTYELANYLFDQRHDPAGFVYEQEDLVRGEQTLLEYMEDFGVGKMTERHRTLGYVVQRSGEKIQSDHV